MVKTKRKGILRTLLFAVFALCFAVGLSSLFVSGTTVYAAAVTTPKYEIPIIYSTWSSINGNKSITGTGMSTSFSAKIGRSTTSTYSVVMYGSSASGTETWNGCIRSGTITIELSSSSGTPTLVVTNSAGEEVGRGTKKITLSGLSDGKYTAKFADNGGWLLNARQYCAAGFNASFDFKVDQTPPAFLGASTSPTGKYTNSSTIISVSDPGSGGIVLYMKTPDSTSYSSIDRTISIPKTGTNGLYCFYAKDKAGNISATHYLYLDTVKPVGIIKGADGTICSGDSINQSFSFTAKDSGSGVNYLQYKTPGSSSWVSYTDGYMISSAFTDGEYQFRAVDKAGNISETRNIVFDTEKPTMIMNSEFTSVANGYKSTGRYVRALAKDNGSGIKVIYYKRPDALSYTEYSEGVLLKENGEYSFYCEDNAGNVSQTYTISLDNTKPTLTSSTGGFRKTVKGGFTVTASDNFSGATLYYKTPNSSIYESTGSSVTFYKTTENGTYSFYAVDGFGNESEIHYMYVSIDAPEAEIVREENSHKVCAIWTDSNCTATLDGKSYTSGTWIEQEGEYVLVLTNNEYNRSATYKITVNHYYAKYTTVESTCTQRGYTVFKCTGCGDSFNSIYTEIKSHDYESEIVKPNCTEQGYTRYICKDCGDNYTDNFVEAEGHKYGEWTTVKEPTCIDLGKAERTCSVCFYVDKCDTDALGHSYKDTIVNPSCTERGNTTHECERCGYTYSDSYTDRMDHDFGLWVKLTEPTCTTSGVEQRECVRCPQTETKIVSPIGHNYKAEVVEPTCLEQGYTTHICSRCGTGYNDTFVPSLGHDYEEIEVAPTCTEEGYRGKKCRRCEDTIKAEIIEAVGHKFVDSYITATCEESGYTLHTCLSCGRTYKDGIVQPTGHDYETEVVREPHCETRGERKFHCTKCKKGYYWDIPATGHNYELTGTEEVNGENIRTYVCTNCGATTTQNMGGQYEQISSYIEYLFNQYQPYMWWVLLATAGVWSISMGIFFAIAQKNEEKEKARKMIKNYVIGLVVIFAILVACPNLVKGIAALIAG